MCAAEESKPVKDYESLYGRDEARVRQTQDPADDIELAGRLLTAAEKAQDQPALAAVLSEKAFDLAAEHPAGHETALAAVDCLESVAPGRAGDCAQRRAAVWQARFDAAPRNDRDEPAEQLIDALLAMVDARLAVGDTAGATKACQRAVGVARAVDSARRDVVTGRLQELRVASRDARDVENLKGLLENNPENVSARERLVRLLLYFGRAAEAPKYLEGVKDADLLKYVPAAAKPLAEVPELACLELGEWYRVLAEEAPPYARVTLYERALAYLERFLGLHADTDALRTRGVLARDKVEKALEALGRSRWIDLLEYVDPSRDTVMGEWRRQGDGLAMPKADPHAYNARILVPVSPSGSYEFKATFVRTSGDNAVSFRLPVGGKDVLLMLSDKHGDRTLLRASREVVRKPGDLENGREHTLHATVAIKGTQASISTNLDGEPLLAGEANIPDLTADKVIAFPEPGCFGLGVLQGTCVWKRVRVKMASGRLKTVRPKPKDDVLKPGKWHDVLAMIDREKDSVDGGWSRTAGTLLVTGPRGGRCLVPVLPQGNYELQALFKPHAPKQGSAGFVLPVGSTCVAVVLGSRGGKVHELLDVVPARSGPGKTLAPGDSMKAFRLFHARVQVDGSKADIIVALDGRPILRWRGPTGALSLPRTWDLGAPGVPGFGGVGTGVYYRKVQLKMLTGHGTRIR